jgi:CelD/BcsL family acetyltransferase involved in cellulose biosynthesis
MVWGLMLSLRTNIARSAPEMDRLEPLWNELLKNQAHTIFQRFSWNRLAAEIFADRLTPNVVWVESDSGAAIIPAAIDHVSNRIQLLGESLFDYRDVLHMGDSELLRIAWQQVARCRKPLGVITVESAGSAVRWNDFPLQPLVRAPQVDRSQLDEHAFRLAHSRLGRQMRRLKSRGLMLRTYTGESSAVVRHVYECKRNRFAADSDNLFLDQRRCDFMVAAARIEGSGCEVFTLESESGSLAAGLVSFRDGDVRRCYTIYFDPEWAHYSPGMALLYEVTARSLAEGLSCDYMTGEYPYKLRLANSSRRLFTVEVSAQELGDIASRMMESAA